MDGGDLLLLDICALSGKTKKPRKTAQLSGHKKSPVIQNGLRGVHAGFPIHFLA